MSGRFAFRRAFSAFPDEVKNGLLHLRALIFDVAARTEGVGRLEETLKWGQPAQSAHRVQLFSARSAALLLKRMA